MLSVKLLFIRNLIIKIMLLLSSLLLLFIYYCYIDIETVDGALQPVKIYIILVYLNIIIFM